MSLDAPGGPVTFRTYRRGDLTPLVELVARAMPADPISYEWFCDYVVLEPNFDPEGLIVAEGGDGLMGMVYAVRGRGVSGIAVDPDGGWITVCVVDPAARRRGIGTELIARAKGFLRHCGSKWVNFSGYPPAYFHPGLDADAYPDGLRLLQRSGFTTMYRPVAMDLTLGAYAVPDDVVKLRDTRVGEGYSFEPAATDDLAEVIAFAGQVAPDWGEVVRAAVVQSRRPDRVVLSRNPAGAVVGFAIYGAYRGLIERFGPFGVAEHERGRGLGKVLLHATLSRMRAEGAHSAWFLWTGKDTPAGQLYLNAGFTVTRTFHVLQADLAE